MRIITLVCLCFVLMSPSLLLAQEEENHPLNPEFAGLNQPQTAEELETLQAMQRDNEVSMFAEGFASALGQAIQEGWSINEIFETMRFSLLGRGGGAEAFYGCLTGAVMMAAATALFLGPLAVTGFVTGVTIAAGVCAARHF